VNRLGRGITLASARLAAALFGKLFAGRNRLYRFEIWLQPWLRRHLDMGGAPPAVPEGTTRHLLFAFVDHFEPGTKGVSLDQARERFAAWTDLYPSLAREFVDSDGRHPQHGFFFPPHYFRDEYMHGLAEFDWQELGETELHLHHEDDTSETLRALLEETLERYADYGVFQCQGDPVRRAYGFIHGNWALDNSRPEYCGVNDELEILAETGCYGDFTFPSLHLAQPRMVNALYRSVDDPHAPKSYDTGRPMRAGERPGADEFAMFTGPIGLRRRSRFPFFAVEDADVTGEGPGTPARVRRWVDAGIHVEGRPEWIFVKVHTHGAPERHRDALLGDGAAAMYRTLCEEFGDGDAWKLHFVNAREMYNIARAAEDGLEGDPGAYRDYEIPPYLTRAIRCDARYRARSFEPGGEGELPRTELHLAEPGTSCTLEFKTGALARLRGALTQLKSRPGEDGGGQLLITGEGKLELALAEAMELESHGEDAPVEEGRAMVGGRACRIWRLTSRAGRSQGYELRCPDGVEVGGSGTGKSNADPE